MSVLTCRGCGRETNSTTCDYLDHDDYQPRKCFMAFEGGIWKRGCAFKEADPFTKDFVKKTIVKHIFKKLIEKLLKDPLGDYCDKYWAAMEVVKTMELLELEVSPELIEALSEKNFVNSILWIGVTPNG